MMMPVGRRPDDTLIEAETATVLGQTIRGHWGIENTLHWTLDVTFQEDLSRVRKGRGAQNMALVRKFAFNRLGAATQGQFPPSSWPTRPSARRKPGMTRLSPGRRYRGHEGSQSAPRARLPLGTQPIASSWRYVRAHRRARSSATDICQCRRRRGCAPATHARPSPSPLARTWRPRL